MDIDAVFETYLKKFSPIRGKDLFAKWQKRTGGSRSQFFRCADDFIDSGMLKRVNGIYYYQDPRRYSVIKDKSDESGFDEAIRMMQQYEKGMGKGFSDEEWTCVLKQPDGKRMLEKAKAVIRNHPSSLIKRFG